MKAQKIRNFISQRISQIDSNYEESGDIMEKLKLSTMRTSFSNILSSYLNDGTQVAASYYQHASTYLQAECYDQASFQAHLAKKNIKDNQNILEAINIIILKCLINTGKTEEAKSFIKEIQPHFMKEEYYRLKAQIMEKLKDENETMEALKTLESLIIEKNEYKSMQMGLFLIQKGKSKGFFSKYIDALLDMNEGMNMLIELKYKNHYEIGKFYLIMAAFNRQLEHYDQQYSALICAHSMIRQNKGKHKELIQTLHKIAKNLLDREESEKALSQLMKIQQLQKQFYGQSTMIVGKTLRKISDILNKLNRKGQAKKYEQQYSRIIGANEKKCPVKIKQSTSASQVKTH